MSTRFDDEDPYASHEPGEDDDVGSDGTSRTRSIPLGRKMSRDDLQDLAKVSSDLLRRTLSSGLDIVKEVGKELPKEATQFINSRKDQVLQNVSKEVLFSLADSAVDRMFALVRQHRIEVTVRIVKDKPQGPSGGDAAGTQAGTRKPLNHREERQRERGSRHSSKRRNPEE